MNSSIHNLLNKFDGLRDVPPLLFRLVLAYGFFGPAMKKLTNFGNTVSWFESMDFFMPLLSAVLATAAEGLGVILLLLGLATRLISIPLMFVMAVAIFAVHWTNGFSASGNGFEIPFYYFLMLFSLLVTGPGKFSLDAYLPGRR